MSSGTIPPLLKGGYQIHGEYLSALIDWCQLTVRDLSPEAISEDLLRIPFELMRTDLSDESGLKGGYSAYMRFDDIRVYEPHPNKPNDGFQIVMAGQGCRHFERVLNANNETWFDFFERALDYNCNFPRIDVAIDDHKTYFKMATLIRMAKNGLVRSKMRLGNVNDSFDLGNGERGGLTLNIGSRASEFFMTWYEKGFEMAKKFNLSKDEIDTQWNRYEMKFRQKRAVLLAQTLVKRREIFTTALEILNDSVAFLKKPDNPKKNKSRYELWEPWAYFMRDIKKLKLKVAPAPKDYFSSEHWVRKATSPTLREFHELDVRGGGNRLLDIIEEAMLTKKHYKQIDDYEKQLKTLGKYNQQDYVEPNERVFTLIKQKESYFVYRDKVFFVEVCSRFKAEVLCNVLNASEKVLRSRKKLECT
ncbi:MULTISPECIES: replication initiation factor domain-containing protein [Listeria]|uniref:replication initiation factor domain-containing protein n=1 Tax=Listeria TaxID=1637 RepID=UPI000B5929B8|nr:MULTISPECIES: replication initiation factor domain-containing protein [Listeria]